MPEPVTIALFYVILRRAKPLLKRDMSFCTTKIPLNMGESKGKSDLGKTVLTLSAFTFSYIY